MPRSPSSSKPDWRRSAKSDAAQGNRWPKRILLTAFLFGLAGALLWLLWPESRPTTNFVVLPVTEYRLWIQPAPAFPANVKRLEEAVGEQEFHLLDGFNQLSDALPEQDEGSILVLYITAHGVSLDGKAYLLDDDFDVAQPESGCLELARLLEQLGRSPAKMKLLVLEAGHTVTDPRLGMLVNEFPRLLETELMALKDPNLWVLSASQSLETSHVSYSLGQSVFSHFFVEGLRGAAQSKRNDDDIELKELFTYVRDGVTGWVKRHSQGSQSQTPLLINSRTGRVDDPPDGLFLLHLARQNPPPDESEPDADPETGGDQSEEPAEEVEAKVSGKPPEEPGANSQIPSRPIESAAAEDDSPPATEAVRSGGEKTPSAEKEPAAEPSASSPDDPLEKNLPPPADALKAPPVASSEDPSNGPPDEDPSDEGDPLGRVRRLLDAAWHWRDELQSRQTDGWSPVDYAPHLWHGYQELILVHEWRWRYQMPLTDEHLVTLKRLAGGRLPSADSGEGTLLARLADARHEFLRGPAKAEFDRWSAQLPAAEAAVKLRNDLLFELPYYLRWHARASQVSPEDRTLFQTISRLVEELGHLGGLLESMEPPSSKTLTARAKLDQLIALTKSLGDLRDELTDRELTAQARSLLEEPADEEPFTRMESLLWTPLLKADLRLALLDSLTNMPDPSKDTVQIAPYRVGPEQWYDGRRTRWAALADQAELQVAVIQKLADPDFRVSVDPATLSDGGSPGAEIPLWAAYRKLGLDLAGFYADLPLRINRALPSDDPDTLRRAARTLALVDSREVHARIDTGAGRLTPRPLAWEAVVGPRPTVSGPETVPLDPGDWSEFSLRIRTTGRPVARVSMLPGFDPTQLGIQSFDGRTTYHAQSPQEITLGPDGEKNLRLRVRPVDDVEKFTPLSIVITAEDDEASHEVRFLIPPPDRVDLVVQRLLDATGRPLPCPAGDVGVVNCPVFPNRPAEYRLGLVNQSGKPRTVTVRFWSVPSPDPQRDPEEQATRTGPLNAIGRPLPGFSPLAESSPIELPADDQFAPLVFPSPDDAEKKQEGEEKGNAPAGDAEKPTDDSEPLAPGEPITHGIVCKIADTENAASWTQWIDFDLIKPVDYIQPTVDYDFAQRKVSIQLRLRHDLELTPGMLSQTPISVLWENALDLPEDTSPNFKASIKRPGGVAQLSAQDINPAVTPQITIRLAVDGYPRALVFERFDSDSDHHSIDVENNLTQIEIVQPEPAAAYRLTDAGLDPTMSVRFKVDAPFDALQRANDFVKVGIDKNDNLRFDEHEQDDVLTFRDDRQKNIVLEEFTPEGTLKLVTRVDDFTVGLSPVGPANKEVLVLAQLFIAGGKSAQDEVPVILDRGQPEISLEPLPGTIPPESQLTVPAKVTDISGIGLVEFGFDLDRSGDLDEDEKPIKVHAADANGLWKAVLDTKDLTPGATYSLIVRATDRVNSTAKYKTLITIGTVPEKTMPEKPKSVSVEGRASLGVPTRWSTLRISGIPGTAAIDKETGDFSFADVPPGQYSVSAKGVTGNRTKRGAATVTVTGDEPTVRVDILMD